MEITHPCIDAYLRSPAPPSDAVREEMERLAAAQRFSIIVPAVGRPRCVLARARLAP